MKMNNKQSLNFFSQLITKSIKPGIEKYGNDSTNHDANFILTNKLNAKSLLDIGSGTGLILKKINTHFDIIHAIEPYKELSNHIELKKNIKVINSNIFDFEPKIMYDMISIFGVMHYFNEHETELVYKKCYDMLNSRGILIIKNQFGIKSDVFISGYSEELNSDYYANYRYIEKEKSLLQEIGYKNTRQFDIYPPELNRWDNTHFYAIICNKPSINKY